MFGLPNGVGFCRLGLTVPRRVGGAVRRNRIKRALREAFRRNYPLLGVPLDLVVNALPVLVDRPTREIEREFLNCYRRLVRRLPR
jgi:ribonuclease P protein component